MKWTRESALEYLSHRKLLTKPADSYTTPYLKRLAGSARTQEQAGQEFSRAKARGKQRKEEKPQGGVLKKERRQIAPIEYYPRDRSKHQIEQWRVMRPPFKRKTPTQLQEMDKTRFNELYETGRDLDHADIQRLYDRTPGGKKSLLPLKEKIYVGITGIGYTLNAEEGGEGAIEPGNIITRAFAVTRKGIATWLTEAPKHDHDSIINFAEDFSGTDWSVIVGISFGYPESWE